MIAMQESARQIRARFYCERAAAIRERAPQIPFADLRSQMWHLASEYERLAAYLRNRSPSHLDVRPTPNG
jgi:hypothetical protein